MRNNYWITFTLMVLLQIIICNYFQFTQYLMLSILPVLILLMPVNYSTITALLVSFAAAFAVDLLGEGGLLGINVVALLPIAFLRNNILEFTFGKEVFVRKKIITLERYGVRKMSTAIIIAQALFLFIYIWFDSAGTRPFWFNLARFCGSLAIGFGVSLALATVLASENRSGWR